MVIEVSSSDSDEFENDSVVVGLVESREACRTRFNGDVGASISK